MRRGQFLAVAVTMVAAAVWLGMDAVAEPTRNAAEAAASTVDIAVATRTLVPGERIEAEDLRWTSWPREALQAGYVVRGQDQLGAIVGTAASATFVAGSPVLRRGTVAAEAGSPTAAMLRQGGRALSLSREQVGGLASLLKPGDRVDVLSALRETRPAGEAVVLRVVAANVRVIALPQRDEGRMTSDGAGVTLELTGRQVQQVMLATETGTLRLALRGHEDVTPIDEEPLEHVHHARPPVIAAASAPATSAGRTDPSGPAIPPLAAGPLPEAGVKVFRGRLQGSGDPSVPSAPAAS